MNPLVKLLLKESSIHHFGCYTEIFIPEGSFIIEYAGEKITADEAIRRERDETRGGIYTFWLSDEWVIDGYSNGNESKYINHSCTPNCSYEITNDKIFIFALRNILPGEELTIDYYYDANSELVPCLCSSEECRGYINTTEEF
jgi:SET domain-containing protein